MDESLFNTLRELAKDGMLSQRELSKRIGLSLGRINFVVNALMKERFIKVTRYKNSKNKIAYRYTMTTKGMKSQVTHTYGFLHKKQDEFERLKKEIEILRKEAHVGDRRKDGLKQWTKADRRKKNGAPG